MNSIAEISRSLPNSERVRFELTRVLRPYRFSRLMIQLRPDLVKALIVSRNGVI